MTTKTYGNQRTLPSVPCAIHCRAEGSNRVSWWTWPCQATVFLPAFSLGNLTGFLFSCIIWFSVLFFFLTCIYTFYSRLPSFVLQSGVGVLEAYCVRILFYHSLFYPLIFWTATLKLVPKRWSVEVLAHLKMSFLAPCMMESLTKYAVLGWKSLFPSSIPYYYGEVNATDFYFYK